MCQPPASITYIAVPSVTGARGGTAHSRREAFHSCDLKQRTNVCTELWRGNYTRGKGLEHLQQVSEHIQGAHHKSHWAQPAQGAFLLFQTSFHCEENFLPFQAFSSKRKNRNPIRPGLSAGRRERVRTERAVPWLCLGHNLHRNSLSHQRNVTFSSSLVLWRDGRAALLGKSSRGSCIWGLFPEGLSLGVYLLGHLYLHLVDSGWKIG